MKIRYLSGKLNKQKIIKGVAFVLLVFYTMVIIFSYRAKILKIQDKYVNTYMKDLMSEANYKVGLKINEKFSLLETVGKCIEKNGIDREEKVKDLLAVLDNNKDTSFSFLAFPDGTVFGETDIAPDYVSEEYFVKAIQGERRISDVYESNSSECVIFAVPVYRDGKVAATLQCGYNISVFADLIEQSAFNAKGSTFVAQNDGLLITRPDSIGDTANLFKLLDNITPSAEKTIDRLKTNLEVGNSGILQYKSGKHKRYICYSGIPECDWYSVTIVSASAIEPQTEKIIKENTWLSIEIIVGFVIFLAIYIGSNWYVSKKKKN